MYAATRRAHVSSEARAQNYSLQDGGAALPSPPTYLQPKRSAARPSTPKGVGRCAPLTACLRRAKLAGRSAGRDTGDHLGSSGGINGTGRTGFSYGLDTGQLCDPGVRSHLGFGAGWGRFLFADHNRTRSINQPWAVLGVRLWSANRKRLAGCGGGCERRAVRAGGREEKRRGGDCGGAEWVRNEAGLRLVGGWWSR